MTTSPFSINRRSQSLLVPTFSTITFVDPSEISHVHAMQNYCMLYRQDGSHVFSSISFGKIMEKLEMYGFFQCHKSYAIQIRKVVSYRKDGNAVLVGEVVVPIARRRRKEFKEVMMRNVGRSSKKSTIRH